MIAVGDLLDVLLERRFLRGQLLLLCLQLLYEGRVDSPVACNNSPVRAFCWSSSISSPF